MDSPLTMIREMHRSFSRCLIPGFDGALYSQAWRDALWDRFYAEELAGRGCPSLYKIGHQSGLSIGGSGSFV